MGVGHLPLTRRGAASRQCVGGSMSNSDYADSPAFGSNRVAAADDEAIAPADYREPKQMTRMEEPPSPMEVLLQKTKLRLVNSMEC